MAGQFNECDSSYKYKFTVLNYWNSEGVTQLIQKRISKQVTEMVREL